VRRRQAPPEAERRERDGEGERPHPPGSKHTGQRPGGCVQQARLHWGVVRNRSNTRNRELMTTDTSIPENPFTDDVDDDSSLARAIQEHLDLKQRNAALDEAMPLDRYSIEDPFQNHPLFKSEEQARLEETLDGVEAPEAPPALPWPGEDDAAEGPALGDGLWGRSRDFDWGE
jgi:hypothetical protein